MSFILLYALFLKKWNVRSELGVATPHYYADN
jgi:hypothetical protein